MQRFVAGRGAAVLALLISVCPALAAQSYPTKPVRLVVGFASGGVTDLVARILGQKLGETLGQQFVVDNRPGGGSVIASDIVAKAAPDGYTLSIVSTSFAINAAYYKKLPYEPIKDFTAIVLVSAAPQVLIANQSLPIKSVADLIALARAKPGQLNFASSGVSSTAHLAGELLKSMAKIDITHVPYKGGAATMLPDVIAGRVELCFFSLPGSLPHIKSGKVRPIAVTSIKRAGAAPDIPTFAESGVAGYEATSWSGLVAPGGTPRPIVAKLNEQTMRVIRTPDVIEAFNRHGADLLGGTPQEFEAYLKAEIDKWRKLVSALGGQLDQFR